MTVPAIVSVDEFIKHEYDFVICGGGTAGLVLANRLTEDPNITVGVIEAGLNRLNDPKIDIPAMCLGNVGNPEYDWFYKSVPQEHNRGKVHHIPRGKALGGSSAINFMVYVRGHTQDYDDWAEITGDPIWSAANIKQYMRKHQSLQQTSEYADTAALPHLLESHGLDGPIKTSFNTSTMPIEDAGIDAAATITGLKRPTDPWSGDHLGFYHGQASIARSGSGKGQRSYAAREYFLPVSGRPNLKVVLDSTVVRVILDHSRAVGVEFINNQQRHKAIARKEVLVCGGVIASPQILELSGIGDPAVLKRAGIPVLVDLPSVGSDLQDHVMNLLSQELAPGVISADCMRHPEVMAEAQRAFGEDQDGPLTQAALSCGYFPATMFLDDDELAEIVDILENGPVESDFQRRQFLQVSRQIQSNISANMYFTITPLSAEPEGISDQSTMLAQVPLDAPDSVLWLCSLQFCASRGYVHVTSNDPFAHPEIDPRYLSNKVDIILGGAALRFLDKVTHSDKLKPMLGRKKLPAADLDMSDREQRRKAVTDVVMGQYHLVGSCAMGHTVDSRLKVKGVQGLRVVDASVFPGHVSGNIQASVYALAELTADIIKADCGLRPLK